MDADGVDGEEQVVKRFVRFALACEYQRMPIRRTAVLEKGQSCAEMYLFPMLTLRSLFKTPCQFQASL